MAYERFKRWLYRGNRPHLLARARSRIWAVLHARGIAPGWLVTLEVPGRRTGRMISFPLVMASIGGERFLVSMLGNEAARVANVRANGGNAVLRHGREERVRLEEVAVSERAPVLKEYLPRAPGARAHVPVSKDAPLPEFESIAAQFPVFRVRAAT